MSKRGVIEIIEHEGKKIATAKLWKMKDLPLLERLFSPREAKQIHLDQMNEKLQKEVETKNIELAKKEAEQHKPSEKKSAEDMSKDLQEALSKLNAENEAKLKVLQETLSELNSKSNVALDIERGLNSNIEILLDPQFQKDKEYFLQLLKQKKSEKKLEQSTDEEYFLQLLKQKKLDSLELNPVADSPPNKDRRTLYENKMNAKLLNRVNRNLDFTPAPVSSSNNDKGTLYENKKNTNDLSKSNRNNEPTLGLSL